MKKPGSKETKKPKGFRPGSRKGVFTQLLSNGIKEAKEKGFAWLTHPNPYNPSQLWRLKIIPAFDKNGTLQIPRYHQVWAFVKSRKGIELCEIHDYKGERIVTWARSGYYRTLRDQPDKKGHILAIITEKHNRVNHG